MLIRLMRPRKINLNRLKQLYASRPTAKALLTYLANWNGSPAGPQAVDQLLARLITEQKANVNRGELIRTLRDFAKAGCGRFRVGRRGQPSRFEWGSAVPSVGRTVTGIALPAPEPTAAPEAKPKTVSTHASNQLVHAYHLRQGLLISLQLPVDLTPHEARRLAVFVRTLPFAEAAQLPDGQAQ